MDSTLDLLKRLNDQGVQYVLDLDALIRAKKALGRPRDMQAIAELEAIRQRLQEQQKTDEGL